MQSCRRLVVTVLALAAVLFTLVGAADTVAGQAARSGPATSSSLQYLALLANPALLSSSKVYTRLLDAKQRRVSPLRPEQLDRGLAYGGSNSRLRRVLAKLHASSGDSAGAGSAAARPRVSIGVIGGSISWGHLVERGVEDWFSRLEQWLRASLPSANLTMRNGCVPATQSGYVSTCLQQFVSADVDLVFVEYATNDGYEDTSVNNAKARAFERLLRKLLALPHAPAVVLMQTLATDARQRGLPFFATAEDQYGVLAQYYGLPALSYRNVVWQGLVTDAPGFSRAELFPPDEERHPTALGHAYLAHLAVHLLQQAQLHALLEPLDEAAAAAAAALQVPPPMFAGNYESTNLVCVLGQELPSVVAANEGFAFTNEGSAAKPKWGFVSWQVGARLVLRLDTRAAAHAGNSSSSSHAAGGDAQPGRPSTAAAAAAVEAGAAGGDGAASSRVKQQGAAQRGTPGQGPAADMIIWVGYLKSWRWMGAASIACLSGCACAPLTIDALHELGNTQQHMAKLPASQAAECLVEVKVSGYSRSGEHKFKVTAVMVTHRVGMPVYGDFTDSVLLDHIDALSSAGHSAGGNATD